MTKIIILLAACLIIGGCDIHPMTDGWLNIGNLKGRPLEVKVVNDPGQADRIKKLEERMEAVEAHLQRQGMRFK